MKPRGPRDVRIMLATVRAARICDLRGTSVLSSDTVGKRTDLDRLHTMRPGFSCLLPYDDKRPPILGLESTTGDILINITFCTSSVAYTACCEGSIFEDGQSFVRVAVREIRCDGG